jgi:hypothetical protein
LTGSVGRAAVLVGVGVGGVDTDGTGGRLGAGVRVGAEVGPADGGGAVGVADGGAVEAGGVAAGPGSVCGADPSGDGCGADGEAVVRAGRSPGRAPPLSPWVSLYPANAIAIASEGPRSTYKVKEARPVWPKARSPGFPTRPPIAW